MEEIEMGDQKEEELRYTPSGIPLKSHYTQADMAGLNYKEKLGDPGEYPYTRGLYPTMYRKTPWATMEVSGFGLPEETNQRQRYLIKEGQAHLFGIPTVHLCFDLATQYGYGSDDPFCQHDIGRCGVAINSLEDMERLFEELPIEKMHTSFIVNASAAAILSLYIAYD